MKEIFISVVAVTLGFAAGLKFKEDAKKVVDFEKELSNYLTEERNRIEKKAQELGVGLSTDLSSVEGHIRAFIEKIKIKL